MALKTGHKKTKFNRFKLHNVNYILTSLVTRQLKEKSPEGNAFALLFPVLESG